MNVAAPPAPVVRKPSVWPGFVVWVVAVGASIVFSIPAIGVMLFFHFRETGLPSSGAFGDEISSYVLTAPVLLASGVASATGLAVTAIAASLLSRWRAEPKPTTPALDLGPSSFSWVRGLGASLGVVGISLGVHALASFLHFGESSAALMLNRAFARATAPVVVLSVLVVGVLAPCSEEILFRGYLLPVFRRRWGTVVGVGISALMFGITHMDLLQGSFAVLVGIYLGWLASKSGSIRWPIAAHAVNNSAAVLLSQLGGRSTTTTAVIVAVLSLTLTAIGILSTRGRRQADEAGRLASTSAKLVS